MVELTKLREQVSSVRQEQMDARLEHAAMAATTHDAFGSAGRAVIRGGSSGGQPAKSIRGGGSAVR